MTPPLGMTIVAGMHNDDTARSDRRSPLRHWLLLAHAGLVAVLLATFTALVLGTPPGSGANIGAGIVGLPLLALGAPWTVPAIVDPYQLDALPAAVWYVVQLGPAVLNVALHAALRYALARLRG